MMKLRYFGLVFLLSLILLPLSVKGATISWSDGLVCENEEKFANNEIHETYCTIGVTIKNGPSNQNHLSSTLELTNIEISDMQVLTNWYLLNTQRTQLDVGKSRYVFEFETPEVELANGYHAMYRFKLTKISYEKECVRNYYGNILEKINRSCTIFEKGNVKYYYDSNGSKTTWKTYKSECDKDVCTHTCNPDLPSECLYFNLNGEVVDSEYEKKASCKEYKCENVNGNYFDNNGNQVDWKKYQTSCNPPQCKSVCNPLKDTECLYFNKDNVSVSEHEMNVSCKVYKCKEVNGQYFNNSGDEVSWQDYIKDCSPKTCEKVCNPKNGSECLYYNKDKQPVTEHDMKVSCNMYKCEIIKGKYYNNSGNEVTWEQYDKDCGEHVCKKVCDPNNGINCLYYDKSGTNVSFKEYEEDCNSYTCKKVCETNNPDNCLYYNKDGYIVLTEEEMKKSCTTIENVYKCEFKDNKYYNSTGLVVSWKDYVKDCKTGSCRKICNNLNQDECLYYDSKGLESTELKYTQECLPHICEQVGDLYYDKNGDVVTSEEEMNESCQEKNYCIYKNGYYFNKEGEVTDKDNYEIECLNPKCKIIKDKYFDKEGKIVTEDEYNKSCNPTIENPQTGTILSVMGLLVILGGGIYLFNVTRKHNKFM